MPRPKHIEERKISNTVNPKKDRDGRHAENLGRLLANEESLVSPAAEGIIALFQEHGIEIEGKHAVILGATELTGKPLTALLLNRKAIVTICHAETEKMEKYTKEADILIVDIAKPKAITGEMIKEGAVVVDCGFNYIEGKLVGDVNYEEASEKAYAITPVPGGVGPMIIAILMRNLIKAVKLYHLK